VRICTRHPALLQPVAQVSRPVPAAGCATSMAGQPVIVLAAAHGELLLLLLLLLLLPSAGDLLVMTFFLVTPIQRAFLPASCI
jgi:hypothetical protein